MWLPDVVQANEHVEFPEVLATLISLDIQCTSPFETYLSHMINPTALSLQHLCILSKTTFSQTTPLGCRLSCLRHHLLKSTLMVWKKHHGDRTILQFRSTVGIWSKKSQMFFWGKPPKEKQMGGRWWTKTPYIHTYSPQAWDLLQKSAVFAFWGGLESRRKLTPNARYVCWESWRESILLFQSQNLKQFLNNLCTDVHWTWNLIGCYCSKLEDVFVRCGVSIMYKDC